MWVHHVQNSIHTNVAQFVHTCSNFHFSKNTFYDLISKFQHTFRVKAPVIHRKLTFSLISEKVESYMDSSNS